LEDAERVIVFIAMVAVLLGAFVAPVWSISRRQRMLAAQPPRAEPPDPTRSSDWMNVNF
jgi:hypothetical protein